MHTKTFFSMILLVLLATSLAACNGLTGRVGNSEIVSGSGNVVTETREVSGFTAVTLQGFGQVIIDQNGSESLTITADDNFMPHLKTAVRGNTLYISNTDRTAFTNVTELTFRISAAALNAVELSGAGSMEITDLDTDRWQVKLPGAGSITVSGQTNSQTVELSGAGSYNAADLTSQEATITSNGAGSVVVNVSDTLDVTINGLGNVEYIGNPTVTQKINGVGSVRQRP